MFLCLSLGMYYIMCMTSYVASRGHTRGWENPYVVGTPPNGFVHGFMDDGFSNGLM